MPDHLIDFSNGLLDPGYTWHHVQDAETMQLVPQILNDRDKGVGHTGGQRICKLR
ncbi:MAG: HNH endonuclease [Chloroflexota bacterium]